MLAILGHTLNQNVTVGIDACLTQLNEQHTPNLPKSTICKYIYICMSIYIYICVCVYICTSCVYHYMHKYVHRVYTIICIVIMNVMYLLLLIWVIFVGIWVHAKLCHAWVLVEVVSSPHNMLLICKCSHVSPSWRRHIRTQTEMVG